MRDLIKKASTCKERYDWYKARGICASCGRAWAIPGRVHCEACAAKIDAYHERSREERNAKQRAIRQERIANGICTECGRRSATPGMRMCPRCREMRNDSTRKYKIHQRTLKMMRGEAVKRGGKEQEKVQKD